MAKENNKIKASKNKANDVETPKVLQKLWADFGELAAQQEILTIQLQQIVKQRRSIYSEIMRLKQEDVKKKQGNEQEK